MVSHVPTGNLVTTSSHRAMATDMNSSTGTLCVRQIFSTKGESETRLSKWNNCVASFTGRDAIEWEHLSKTRSHGSRHAAFCVADSIAGGRGPGRSALFLRRRPGRWGDSARVQRLAPHHQYPGPWPGRMGADP